MSHSPNSTQLRPSGRLHRLRSGLALLALTLSLSLATNAFGIVAPTAVDIQSCATEYIQIGDEALTWGELKTHDKAQTSQAFESPAAAKQALFEAKLAYSPINTGASSYENKSDFSTLSSVKPAQRYEKVTDIASSFKEQTLLHITLSNGQTIQATAGHPFKTLEGWRDAVLLKKGGQLLLGGEGDSSERFATILEIREEVKTTAVFNLEVANLHTFFVGVEGVVVHNGVCPPSLKKKWEKLHGKDWPLNPPTEKIRPGLRQDGHHITPVSKGGPPNDPSNITPKTPSDHIKWHQENGYK